VFNGNGKLVAVSSGNFNGEISRKERFSGTYTVEENCTGTTYKDGVPSQYDLFIAPDGSMYTFLQINPPSRWCQDLNCGDGQARRRLNR
jgi:hypothetical protein